MTSRFVAITPGRAQPEEGAPAPDRIISGEPKFRSWNIEEQPNGLYAGIWESSPGKWRVQYDEWEFCHILSGVSIVEEEGGQARTVKSGDAFVLQPGFRGTWEVVETTRKEYVIKV